MKLLFIPPGGSGLRYRRNCVGGGGVAVPRPQARVVPFPGVVRRRVAPTRAVLRDAGVPAPAAPVLDRPAHNFAGWIS